jgi:hypothetical protein
MEGNQASATPQTAGTESHSVGGGQETAALVSRLQAARERIASPQAAEPSQTADEATRADVAGEAEEAATDAESTAELRGSDVAEADEQPGGDGAEGEAEAEAPDAETVELPESLDDFAKALELEPDALHSLRVKVKVNGKEQEVTLEEAIKGYSRESDYTQRTTELANQRRTHAEQVERSNQAIRQRFEQVETMAQALAETLQGSKIRERIAEHENPNSPSYDPGKAYELKQQLQAAAEIYQRVAADRDAQQKQAQAERDQKRAKWRGEQVDALLGYMPDLKDATKLAAFEREIAEGLPAYGFSIDEVKAFAGSYDARQMRIVRDALKYRALEKSRSTRDAKLKELPKKLKPGTKKPGIQQSKIDDLKARFRKTNDRKAGAALLQLRRKGTGR